MRWFLLAVLTVLISPYECYKFLGVFPTTAPSHWKIGYTLVKGLIDAGHEVTVVTPFTVDKYLKNIKLVQITWAIEELEPVLDDLINNLDHSSFPPFPMRYGENCTMLLLNHKNVMQLMHSNEKFDAVIVESFFTDALYGFAAHFKAPLIALSTFGASKLTTDLVGSPSPRSYIPHPFSSYTDRMTFKERMGNLYMSASEELVWNFIYLPKQESIYNTYFPFNNVSLNDIRKNTSLVLLNSHFSLNGPRPNMPNMIEIGGFHINRKVNPLPGDLKEFLDNAPNGVIYFSMGSNLESTQLPAPVRASLIECFGRLKQKVFWKWEDPKLPGKTGNVMIRKWYPQSDILAHPNLKLFITHGGLLSTQEAIYHGVPIIGIPMFGDQHMNMAKAVNLGYGVTVPYRNISEENLYQAIQKILNNPMYTIKAKEMSKAFRDQQNSPLETAIYWVEYVARHKGANHIKNSGVQLNFIAYHNLDVFTVFFLIFGICLWLTCKICKCACKCVFGSPTTNVDKVKVY